MMTKEVKKIQPFNEGKLAFLAGKSIGENPYPSEMVTDKGMNCKISWTSGYENEKLEYECSRSPKPDPSIIMEAEILIPQSSDWNSHELSRYLSYYIESCKGTDKRKMIIFEKSLRMQVVKARLEKHLK